MATTATTAVLIKNARVNFGKKKFIHCRRLGLIVRTVGGADLQPNLPHNSSYWASAPSTWAAAAAAAASAASLSASSAAAFSAS